MNRNGINFCVMGLWESIYSYNFNGKQRRGGTARVGESGQFDFDSREEALEVKESRKY